MDHLLGSRYVLHEPVGRGAMGQVFSGSIRDTGAPVAVKILKPELVSDPDIVARFIQERSILLSINHPNVVRVLDLVVEGQTLGIVMELVNGQDLRHELHAQRTLPPAAAVRHCRELLDGLAAVHNAGIVHRDVKPENLLIDAAGSQSRLKLTDFGVARLTYGGSLTKLSSVIGTPEYMAPEVADHETATPAADMYSTGIVLYEMLCGRTPFAGGHPMAVLRRHLDEMPPPIPAAPTRLWAVIDSLLAKDPDARPRCAETAEALLALEPSLADVPALAPMPAPVFQSAVPRRSATPPGLPATPVAHAAAPDAQQAVRPATQIVDRSSLTTSPDDPIPAPADGANLTIDAPSRRAGRPAATGSDPSAKQTAAPRGGRHSRPWFRRPWPVTALALSLAVLIAAAAVTTRDILHQPGASDAVQPSHAVSYVFAPQAYPDSLLIVRHWTLSGPHGSVLTETATASSADGLAHRVSFLEAIPSGIAATVQTVRFTPAAAVVQADPLVKWQLDLPAQGTVTVGYRATVPPAGAIPARLAGWARALAVQQKQLHLLAPPATTIQSLVISPATIELVQNQNLQLSLQGQLADGSRVSPQVLATATWASANTAVADVTSSGLVTATGTGSTFITARLGGVLVSASLAVTSSPSSPAPNTGTPATSTTPATVTYTFQVFHTCRGQLPCGLHIRKGPGTSYPILGLLQNKQPVQVVCQVLGQDETNSKGVSTDVWDELLDGGYVSDLYINTPGSPISQKTTGFTTYIPRC